MVTTLNLSMIIDSCVLIDYMQGPTNICSLIASHIGPIYVATPILDEVDSIRLMRFYCGISPTAH